MGKKLGLVFARNSHIFLRSVYSFFYVLVTGRRLLEISV